MKKIGLIGGMSWESSDLYYQKINKLVNEKMGGLNSAHLILYSVNFQEIEHMQSQGRWDDAAAYLKEIAQKLEVIGVDAVALCTNTMHLVAPEISNHISIPFFHIADAVADEINLANKNKVLLLGTKFTMQKDFYKNKLNLKGIEVVVPSMNQQEIVHSIIYDELCLGKILEKSKQDYISIIHDAIADGVQGVVLGCTEIGMLLSKDDVSIPLFDSTEIHVNRLVDFIVNDE